MEEQAPPLRDRRRYFAALTDPSSPTARHHVLDMIVLAIGAGLCGVEGWEEIAAYGHVPAPWCAALLEVPHGIPSPDP